jgi:hypothetical protein
VKPAVEVVRSDDPGAAILAAAARCDLLILGLRRSRQGRKTLGAFNRDLAFDAPCAVILLSRRPAATASDVVRPIREVAKVLPWTPRRADSEGR